MEQQRAYHFRNNGKIALRYSLGTAYGIILTVGVISYVLGLIINQIIGMVPLANMSLLDPESWVLFAERADTMRDIEVIRWSLDFMLTMFTVMIPVGIAAAALKAILALFVKAPIRLGEVRWFSRNREVPYGPQFSLLFSFFKSGSYGPGVRGMFWKQLILFVWSLPQRLVGLVFAYGVFAAVKNFAGIFKDLDSLSRLPKSVAQELLNSGMIMLYAMIFIAVFSLIWQIVMIYQRLRYQFVDWLLADQPQLAPKRATALSKEMAQGLKWEIVKIYLFYLIFHILVTPLLIIALFLRPLINAKREAALAEVYAYARDTMVSRGRLTMEELGYRKQPQDIPPETEYFTVGTVSDTKDTPPVIEQAPQREADDPAPEDAPRQQEEEN